MPAMSENQILAAREEWLYELTDALTPHFDRLGYSLPFDRIRIGIGYTSSGLRKNSASIGQCLYPHGEFKNWELTIRLDQHGDDDVSSILVHELCHVALPFDVGHKKPFRDLMARFGVQTDSKGRDICKHVGELSPGFLAWIHKVRENAGMGPYPHLGAPFAYEGGEGKKKEQQNMTVRFKCQQCGCTGAQSAKWFAKSGEPFDCNNPECTGGPMEVAIQKGV